MKYNNMYHQEDWVFQQYVRETTRPKLLPTDFYYNNRNQMVFTESYHLRRGSCCDNGCLHCPYKK